MLATHPEVEEKLIAEIDAITGGDPDYELQYTDLMALPYMTQVIKETLRIYPPMPVTIRRSLKDGMLGPYRVRKDDIILVGALAAQRDPRYWGPQADVFDPDQFAMEKVVERPRHAFIPFSVGKRQCMAQEVTFMMLRVALFEIYNRYRLRLAPGAKVVKNTVGHDQAGRRCPLFVCRVRARRSARPRWRAAAPRGGVGAGDRAESRSRRLGSAVGDSRDERLPAHRRRIRQQLRQLARGSPSGSPSEAASMGTRARSWSLDELIEAPRAHSPGCSW